MLSQAVSDAGDPKPKRHFPVGGFEDYSILVIFSLNNFFKIYFSPFNFWLDIKPQGLCMLGKYCNSNMDP